VKHPDTPGVEVQGIVVLVDVLVVVVVLVEVLVVLVEVGGRTIGCGSPQWASEHVGASPSPTSVTRHTLLGSAQCENGRISRSQSVGTSQRGPRGSTHRHPAKSVNTLRRACTA
jgi:hypothetical protein